MGGAIAPLRPVACLQLVLDLAICHTQLRADVDQPLAGGLVLPDGAVRTTVTWELRCTNFSCATCRHRSCTDSSRYGMGDCCCCCGRNGRWPWVWVSVTDNCRPWPVQAPATLPPTATPYCRDESAHGLPCSRESTRSRWRACA